VTRALLTLIDGNPRRKRPTLAERQGRELPAFKRDVRKLKEPGLIESLERAAPRIAARRAVMRRRRA
jgi:predicted transcriptional regulator